MPDEFDSRRRARMTPDQQRAVDQAIIDGRLVDAIAAYRAATGAGLAAAEHYVRNRGAAVTGSAASAVPEESAPTSSQSVMRISSGPLPRSVNRGIVVGVVLFVTFIVIVSVVVPLAITAGAFMFAFPGVNVSNFTHSIAAAFTITKEPYYPDVVKQIRDDAKFKDALGAPIVIDDGGVSCNHVQDDYEQRRASCTIPVHGPKASGSVRVEIVDQATTLNLGAWLDVNGRTIPINS